MRILVVEDDTLLAFMVEEALKGGGYAPLGPARTAAAALAIATADRPDLALVDIDLGEAGSGVEVVRQLAERLQIASVYLTGQEGLARSHSDHALGLVSKPVSPDELLSAVDFLAGRRAQCPSCLRLFSDSTIRAAAQPADGKA